MAAYDDVFARDNFGDSGTVPSAGNPYQSPDVIPRQAGTFTAAQAVSTYNGPDQGQPIVNAGVNNIYIRAKNLQSSGTETGTVALYWSKASLLMVPAQWSNNVISTGSGQPSATFLNQSGSGTLQPGDIALSNPSFVLTGLPPSPNDHYCLVAVVQTPRHTIDIPATFPSNAAFAAWVQSTPAVAWRNIAVVPNSVQQLITNSMFGNINPQAVYTYFRIQGRKLPVGTTVRAQNADSKCPIDWTGTLPAPDPSGNQIIGFEQQVPATYNSTMLLTATPPKGTPLPPGSTLSMTYFQVPSAEPDEHEQRTIGTHLIAREVDGRVETVEASLIVLGQINFYVEALS